jgi:thiol:disulfide interchange protein DsbG
MKYFLAFLFCFGLSYAVDNSPAVDLVNQLTHNQYQVINTFTASNGWTGVVLQSKTNKTGTIVYVDPKANYVFYGTILDANGNNLSQAYSQKYLMNIVMQELSQDVVQANWIQQGSDNAAHKLYIFFDPNCIYCHRLYQNIQNDIASGVLQVRWIPVGLVKDDSAGKSAKILSADNTNEALALLKLDESSFNYLTEEGGITALAKGNDKVSQKAYQQVEQNNQLFEKYGFSGTPVIVYKNSKGKPSLIPGYVRSDQLTQVIHDAGAW